MLWLCVLVGMVAGAVGGGWRSLRLARSGDIPSAERLLGRSAFVAALGGMLAATATLGWPFISVSVSMPEEVTRTTVETVMVPIKVSSWVFWTVTKQEPHQVPVAVTETVYRSGSALEFSPLMLVPLAAVGWFCYWLERKVVHLLWRFFG